MKYISLHHKITNQINRLRRNFVWVLPTHKKKLHLVSWDTITKPKDEGGFSMHKAYGSVSSMDRKLVTKLPHGSSITVVQLTFCTIFGYLFIITLEVLFKVF